MAEEKEQDDSQKTEDPTAHRLEEARKKGQIAFSKEIINFLVIGCCAAMIPTMPYIAKSITLTIRPYIELSHAFVVDGPMLHNILSETLLKLALPLGLFFGGLVVTALFAGFGQTRGNVSLEKIKPKLEKISLAKGAKRMFSKNSLVELLKGIAKISLIAGAVSLVIYNELLNLQDWAFKSITNFLPELKNLFWLMILTVLCIMFFIAGGDYIFQKMEHKKKLKMSRHDIKEENKKLEGNPEIKSKLKQIRSERAKKRMMSEVPKATAVITNPTHYAVAIKYEMEEMDAPTVVAKGVDQIALRIREVAEENDVPVFENPPLARALYETTELEDEIPADHYKAVAEIIRVVMQLKQRYFK